MNMELCSFLKRKQQTKKHAHMAIMFSLLFLFSSFDFCFGVDEDLFLPQIAENSNTALRESGAYFGKYGTSGWSGYVGCVNYDDVIYGVYTTPNTTDGLTFAVVTNHSDANIIRSSSNTSKTGVSISLYEGSEDIYTGSFYNISSSVWIDYSTVPVYESIEDMVSFFEDDVVGGDIWSGPATVSVEAGCVAYILVDGGTANITTTFPELSKLSRPLWVSGSTYSLEEELPSSGKVFSSTTGTLIDWLIPASAKKDLLGRAYNGGKPLSDLPSGQYLVVYNPVYRGYDDKGVGIMSPTIYVSLSNYGAVRQYRLTASYNGGIIESTSEDGYTSWFDSIGEEELDANGNPIYIEHKIDGTTASAINIPAGGGNIIIDTENADNSIGGLLQRLVNLLSAPIRYIENLFNAGVGFFSMLASLWSWLPEEVSTIIASALVVLIVIGVVKFLWK